MPRPDKPSALPRRLGDALADIVRDVLDGMLPAPEPEARPIPVRAKDRR